MLSTIVFYGARGRNRTGMPVLWAADFKSAVSTDSTKQAPDFFLAKNRKLRKAKNTTS